MKDYRSPVKMGPISYHNIQAKMCRSKMKNTNELKYWMGQREYGIGCRLRKL